MSTTVRRLAEVGSHLASIAMTLQLEIVSEHRDFFGDDAIRVFNEEGGTIGRSLQNDWILPDENRYISGRHATIDFQGGAYYLADTSTNGVYVNDEAEPIGKGNPRRLFSGDRLRMGDFKFSVKIDEGEDLEMPEDPPVSAVPDHIEQLVPMDTYKTGVRLLDEEEITGDDEFQSILFSEPDAMPEERPAPTPVKLAKRPQKRKIVSDIESTDLFITFLDSLGIDRSELHPSVDPADIMHNAGQVLREFIVGISELLMSRATLKNAFRLNQTTVMPRHNNPLKLSADTNVSIKQLLVGGTGEYLGPRDAVREVCRDLLYHQDAFLDAMNQAFVEFADRFDPDELADGFERTLNRKPLFGFMTESKYWQLYRELYPIMTEKGGGRFPQMFSEEFVKAYERHIAESKRSRRDDTEHAKTIVLPEVEKEPQADDDEINEKEKNPGDKKKPKDEYVDPYSTLKDSQRIAPSKF